MRSGGTARLAPGRPWTVVAWVHGFLTWKHALKFERAWQLGFASACMRDVARFPTRGVLGKLRVLHALLHTRVWYWHALHVTLVSGASPGVCDRRAAALDGYVRLSWYDPTQAE